jgi:hypothetical protein
MRTLVGSLMGLLLLGPGSVAAQSPTTPAHPALPWSLGPALPQGQLMDYLYVPSETFIRDIWVPPQPVVVDMMVALPPQSAPTQAAQGGDSDTQPKDETQYGTLRQTFTVPGYYVRETTVGFHYPERWVLDQSYTWRLLPAEFWPRPTVTNPGWPPSPRTVPSL